MFLIGNARKPNVAEIFRQLESTLSKRGVLVGADLDGRPEQVNQHELDFVISLGGDGTILAVGQAMQHKQVPIIGVNLGKLGYLAHFSVPDLQHHLDRVFADPSLVSRRMLLNIALSNPNGHTTRGIALNDCVPRVGEPFRTVGLALQVDDHPVTTIVSDGLIIATPTGSTAHNMACGGPILFPDVEAIILTPLCPHSLTHRPVVVSPNSRVTINVRSSSAGVAVVLDGQAIHSIAGGSSISIQKSPHMLQLVQNPDRRSWDLLIHKLKWGQALT